MVHVVLVKRAPRTVCIGEPHLSQRKAPMTMLCSDFVALQPCAFVARVSIPHLHLTAGGGERLAGTPGPLEGEQNKLLGFMVRHVSWNVQRLSLPKTCKHAQTA